MTVEFSDGYKKKAQKKLDQLNMHSSREVEKSTTANDSEQPSSLADWSETIRKIGEEHRKQEDEALEQMQLDLPNQITKLSDMTNEELVNSFQAWSQRGFADPRKTKVIQDLAEHAKTEILFRMIK